MAAHSWWRILVSANHGHGYTSIAEVEMHDTPGGPDLCEGGTAISSPFYNDGGSWICSPAKAFDNDRTTPQSVWLSRDAGVFPVWLGYRFASPVEIVEVVITFRTAWQSQDNTGQSIRDFTMQWSDDGVAWYHQASFATLPVWGNSETRVFSLAAPQPHAMGGAIRTAPGAIFGASTRHVLHNRGTASPLPEDGVSPSRMGSLAIARPRDFWGRSRIEGKITVEGTPASRRVRLFDALTGLLIAETWSRHDGRYRFDFLDPARNYVVLAHDHLRQFNAVVADGIQPEPARYP